MTEEKDFASDRERWEEQEAVQMERHREYLLKECLPGWMEKLQNNPHPSTAQQVYEICLKMQNYESLAWGFRRSRYARLEYEAYEKAGLTR